jgi:HSP20 family protein
LKEECIMLGYWSGIPDLEHTLSTVGELRRRMFADVTAPRTSAVSWPRTSVYDSGEALVLLADLPGVKSSDLEITLERDVLTVSGERKPDAPEGYAVLRQERRAARFERSFALPYKVDSEKLAAELKDGVLRVSLPKAAEAQPRKITVNAA